MFARMGYMYTARRARLGLRMLRPSFKASASTAAACILQRQCVIASVNQH